MPLLAWAPLLARQQVPVAQRDNMFRARPRAGMLFCEPPTVQEHPLRQEKSQMKFIEMTGKTLKRLIAEDELHSREIGASGVADDTIVRINRQGDIEIRRAERWDVIGGLLGNYEQRIKHETGLDWAE
jgi:hypothetical protein